MDSVVEKTLFSLAAEKQVSRERAKDQTDDIFHIVIYDSGASIGRRTALPVDLFEYFADFLVILF